MTLAERVQRAWVDGGLLAQMLRPLGWLHRGVLKVRSLLWRAGVFRAGELPVPVIVVGNWIVGGAGKTPTTLALLDLLAQRGIQAGVVSRGYGRQDEGTHLVSRNSSASQAGDEPL
ncbi:MAG TPA: tetraacyldisaccharide 4'-kinase, partial [Burkholderiaceae bacterium]